MRFCMEEVERVKAEWPDEYLLSTTTKLLLMIVIDIQEALKAEEHIVLPTLYLSPEVMLKLF